MNSIVDEFSDAYLYWKYVGRDIYYAPYIPIDHIKLILKGK